MLQTQIFNVCDMSIDLASRCGVNAKSGTIYCAYARPDAPQPLLYAQPSHNTALAGATNRIEIFAGGSEIRGLTAYAII